MDTRKLRDTAMRHVPDARARLVASNHFYRVISLWEALALHGNGAIPTITSTLRGNATGFRDQTWPRRLASIAVTGLIGFHLLGGYPRKYYEELAAQLAREAEDKAAANGSFARTGH